MNKDAAEIRMCEKLFRKYLDKVGYTDKIIPGIIGNTLDLRDRLVRVYNALMRH